MTLLDLYMGNYTWAQLARELLPASMASASAYLAGYWRGRVVEQRESLKALEPAAPAEVTGDE